MRKIFSSLRLENVEAVARLLEAEGIEVRIENGRALHRAIRGNFSYRDDGKNTMSQPEVWVVRSDDQPRARALMREAGLLQDTTRTDAQLYAPKPRPPERGHKRILRLRYGLIALALIVVVVNFMRRPEDQPVPSAATSRPPLTMLDDTQVNVEGSYIIATPPLLAVMLAKRALGAHAADALCLSIDGQDAADSTLAALAAEGITAQAESACTHETALHLDIRRYTTDGSGSGTVLLTRHTGTSEPLSEEISVRRSGAHWSVIGAD